MDTRDLNVYYVGLCTFGSHDVRLPKGPHNWNVGLAGHLVTPLPQSSGQIGTDVIMPLHPPAMGMGAHLCDMPEHTWLLTSVTEAVDLRPASGRGGQSANPHLDGLHLVRTGQEMVPVIHPSANMRQGSRWSETPSVNGADQIGPPWVMTFEFVTRLSTSNASGSSPAREFAQHCRLPDSRLNHWISRGE